MKSPNSSLLARRLRPLLSSFSKDESSELINLILQGLGQLHSHTTVALRSRFQDLLCPYCGQVHSLDLCTHPGVDEYRLDPQAWMDKHIPAGVRQKMGTLKVKEPKAPKKSCSVSEQNLPKVQRVTEEHEVFDRKTYVHNVPSGMVINTNSML